METPVWNNDDSELCNNHNFNYIPTTYKEQNSLHEYQYPDSTKNSKYPNPTQVCVNCSKLLETGTENDAIFEIEVSEQFNLDSSNSTAATSNAYQTEFGEPNLSKKIIKVRTILESVYKLNYLDLLVHPEAEFASDSSDPLRKQLEKVNPANSFNDDGLPISLNENICLCSQCSQVLSNMYKYYLLFNQLRELNSFLAKKINRLDEKFGTTQSPRPHQMSRPRRPTLTSTQKPQEAVVDDALTAVKCEVLMEQGIDESIFTDADHFDDRNYFSQDESTTENEQFDFTVHTQENSMARAMSVPDLMETNVGIGINNLSHVIVKNDPQDFPYQSSTSRLTVPGPGPAVDYENLKNPTNLIMSGPWVRLKRLRNIQVGCPVLVSNLNQNPSTNFHEFDNNNLLGGKGRKTSKSINRVENIHLVFSEPSDNDDPNDSDFHIESESIPSKRKRNVTLRPKRRKIRNKNQISKLKLKNSSNTVSEEEDNGANLRDDTNDDAIAVDGLSPSSSSKSDPNPKAKIGVLNKNKSVSSNRNRKKKANASKTGTKRSQIKLTPKSKLIISASPKASISSELNKEKRRAAKRRSYKIDNYYRRRKVLVPNPCWHCELDFPTPEECYDHAKATHYKPGTGDFICSRCGRVCPNILSYTQHQHNICEALCPGETLAPYKCHHCGKGFPYKQYLDNHLPAHIQERNFPCLKPGCDFKGKSVRLLNSHIARMHDEEREREPASSDGQVILSVVGKGEPISYKCDHCEAIFKTELSRQLHAAKFHTEDGYKKYREQQRVIQERRKEERKAKIEGRSSICPECDVDLLTNLRLICHRKTAHNVVDKFVCDECGKNFSRLYSLRKHIQYTHTESRPFICEHCGKTFKTSQNLKDHVSRTHSEEGRQKYNELHRSQNQKRKLVAKALLSKKQTDTE